MRENGSESILLIGESNVGKTHYGAQLLRRLLVSDGKLKMRGAATNLEPFEAALESLDEGRAANHTPTDVYLESMWPVGDDSGLELELVWPDYGGEQIVSMIANKRVPSAWQTRIASSSAWILLIRPSHLKPSDDLLSKPSATSTLAAITAEESHIAYRTSDQARLMELLQMLLYIKGSELDRPIDSPRLLLLLTCWDELGTSERPETVLAEHLPMLYSFVKSNWNNIACLGLSALGRSLAATASDPEYVAKGPEQFGYVIRVDGSSTPDLTVPIYELLGMPA